MSLNVSRQRAFTIVELCLGLVITSLVMGAMAAFCMAMSTAWKSAEKSQALTLMGTQAVLRLQHHVRQSRLIGACRAGTSDSSGAGAAVMLWKEDSNGDGYIQGNEVEMIEHNTTAHTLEHYKSGQPDAAGTWSYSATFTSAAVFDQFKMGRTCETLAPGVYGAVFQTSGTEGTSRSPSVQFALKLMVDDSQATENSGNAVGGEPDLLVQYGTATLRAPMAKPDN